MTTDPAPQQSRRNDERGTLEASLDAMRDAVTRKAQGLSDADGARRLVPSLTTVSGLVRHLADVERDWFRTRLDGQDGVPTRFSDEDPDGEFRVTADDSLEAILDDYAAACAESREVVSRYRLDDTLRARPDRTVRWLFTHLIEETARHAGHVDILRELLDGETGD